jgi:integrase/recombinase XerD
MAKAKVLTSQEIKRVLVIAETGINGLRDKTALALSIMAGMRIGEIAALTLGDMRVTWTPDWYRSEVESFALMADG